MPNLNDFNVWLFHWSKESFKIFVKTTHFLNFNSDTKKDTTKETTRLLISTDVRILTKISAKDSLKNNNQEKGFQGRQNTFCRPRNCKLAAQSGSVHWVRGTDFLEGWLKWHLMWPIAWSWWLGNPLHRRLHEGYSNTILHTRTLLKRRSNEEEIGLLVMKTQRNGVIIKTAPIGMGGRHSGTGVHAWSGHSIWEFNI